MYPAEEELNQEPSTYTARSEARPAFFDFFLGAYLIAMSATNFSAYNDLLSTVGLVIPLAFVVSLLVNQVKLEREFYALILFYIWLSFGSYLSDYKALALASAFYVIKVQAITFIVAFRCNSFKRMRFYIAVVGIGATCLVLPTLMGGGIPVGEERLGGVAGQANAMGYITAAGAIAWTSLLVMGRHKLRWLVYPFLALAAIRVLFLTGSRGAFVTFAGFLVVILWLIWHRGGIHVKILLPLIVILVAVFAGRFLVGGAPLLERLARFVQAFGIDVGVSATEESGLGVRKILIRQAIEIFKDHPILGAGWGTFRVYSDAVYTHTTPFELLYATGIVGTCLYYYVVISGVYTLIKGRKIVRDYLGESTGVQVCLALVAAQLAAGLAIPIISNKIFAPVPGIWLGVAWYVRTLRVERMDSEAISLVDSEVNATPSADIHDAPAL